MRTAPATDTAEWDDLMANLGLTPSNRPTPLPPARKPIQHGTYSGYRAHRRYSETPCPACREALTTLIQILDAKETTA